MPTQKEHAVEFSRAFKSYTAALVKNLPSNMMKFGEDLGRLALNKLLSDNANLSKSEKRMLMTASMALYSAMDDKAQIAIMMSASAKAMELPDSEKYAELAGYHHGYLAMLYNKKEAFELDFIKAVNSDDAEKALNELGIHISDIPKKLNYKPYETSSKFNASKDYKTFYDLSKYMARGAKWEDEYELDDELEDDYELEEDELSDYELVNMYINQYYQISEVEAKTMENTRQIQEAISGNVYGENNDELLAMGISPDIHEKLTDVCRYSLEKGLENALGKDNVLRNSITLGELDKDIKPSVDFKTFKDLKTFKDQEPVLQKQKDSPIMEKRK